MCALTRAHTLYLYICISLCENAGVHTTSDCNPAPQRPFHPDAFPHLLLPFPTEKNLVLIIYNMCVYFLNSRTWINFFKAANASAMKNKPTDQSLIFVYTYLLLSLRIYRVKIQFKSIWVSFSLSSPLQHDYIINLKYSPSVMVSILFWVLPKNVDSFRNINMDLKVRITQNYNQKVSPLRHIYLVSHPQSFPPHSSGLGCMSMCFHKYADICIYLISLDSHQYLFSPL